MYSREEEFWAQRLAALQSKGRPGSASLSSWNHVAANTSDYIPAYQPPRPNASPPRLPQAASQQLSAALVPAGSATSTVAAARAPAAQLVTDALVQAAQVEALKLQVAQLRKANAALQQQLAAANAARAAAAKQAALHRLSSLQPDTATAAAGTAAASGTASSEAQAAAAAALSEELGVALPPGADMVPLLYLQQLHACYTRRLAEEQQRHADALAARAAEAQAQLRRQAEQHARRVRLLTEGLDDPARDAEVQLLRDDCRYLKEKLQQLGAEYEQRVQVAATEARLAVLREAAEQRCSLEAAVQEELHSCQAQQAEAQAAAAVAAEDAAALERARHAAEMARLREQHAAELRRVRQECADSLAQWEAQHDALLAELHRLRADMRAAPSRAGTQQEGHLHGWQPEAATSTAARAVHQQPQQWQRERRSPTPPPGQLMELASDEDEEYSNGGMQQQHREEQPRLTPELLQHLKAAPARLRPQVARLPQR